MIRAPLLKALLAVGALALALPACAGKPESDRTVLAGIETAADGAQTRVSDPRTGAFEVEGPLLLPFRNPAAGGIAYRITLEIEGERASRQPTGSQQPAMRETQKLEAHVRMLPVEGADAKSDVFLLGLDGLLYSVKQQSPEANREIELADDRLRIRENGEISLDNRGNRSQGPLTPRILLDRIFGVINHDPNGNPTHLAGRGSPAARKFMSEIPIFGATAYTMLSLPGDPVGPGSSWTGIRIPPSHSGELGLALNINYSLTGFEIFDGVPCAMILIDARINGNGILGVTGNTFDRVQATLHGTAWVELENSLVHRVVMNDEISAIWTTQNIDKSTTEHRMQHESQLTLTLRDHSKKTKKWSDGTPLFDSR